MIPAILADFQPISPGFQLDVYSLILIFAAIAGIVIGVLGLWISARRKPTLEAHLVKLELTIEGLQGSVEKLTATQEKQAGHEIEITALKEKVRSLEGRLENDIGAQRRNVAHVNRELGEKIDNSAKVMEDKLQALSDTLNKEFRDLYRALGKAEGQLEHGN